MSIPVEHAVGALTDAVTDLQALDLEGLSAEEAMALTRAVEVVRRRLDAGTDRLAGHLDETAKHLVDGHRTAKAALGHLGRLSGAEAFGRVRTARMLRALPAVAAAYERGELPTAFVRAVARMAANPRVGPLLDEVIDKVIADLAAEADHTTLLGWLRDFENLADADGAEQRTDRCHRRRAASLNQNPIDGGWELRAGCGALQGASMAEVLAAYETAEWEADRAEAVAMYGPDATPDQFPRTPAQRRMDALHQIFRRAAATPADAQSPEPIVNIVIDHTTLEVELARLAGHPTAHPTAHPTPRPDPERVDERICRTVDGRPLHPSDAVAALLVGHVRRVVIDAASTVIDLGRKRRCFTGSSKDAARLQAAIRDRSGLRCFWSACGAPPHRHQTDHHDPWRGGGPTDIANSDIGCPYHNRLKETGYRPVRQPDGTYQLVRPDGTPITPSA
ncbi:MAG TPA: DUF222 domain-containing protein [Acidimicrobiales bacterium]